METGTPHPFRRARSGILFRDLDREAKAAIQDGRRFV
jgi:hypothetical protein